MGPARNLPEPPATTATVGLEDRGQRLDVWLARRFPDWSRSRLQEWIRAGRVLVDQGTTAANRRLRGGEEIEIRPPAPRPSTLEPVEMPLTILYRDPHLLVLVKPAGLVVHPGAGTRAPTLVHGLLALGEGLSLIGGVERPGIVHRLDRDTSGLMVVACDDVSHRALSTAFAQRRVRKQYHALCWGRPRSSSGVIDLALGRDPVHRTTMSSRGRRRREARTGYAVVEKFSGFSLLELDLMTGRTHQIRAHLKSLGHPVVGDREYGGGGWRQVRDPVLRAALRRFDRLALHASRLSFEHPVGGKTMSFEAPLPAEIEALLAHLRRPQGEG